MRPRASRDLGHGKVLAPDLRRVEHAQDGSPGTGRAQPGGPEPLLRR